MLHGKSARNPLGWTKQELRATILQLKRDFPEMPGIGYYGSDPGVLAAPGRPAKFDCHPWTPGCRFSDNATLELIRYASQLSLELFPDPPLVRHHREQCPNSTSWCPTAARCCEQKFSPSKFGCRPTHNYTGSSQGCGDPIPARDEPDHSLCCKMGPANPMSNTLPNCIILGDSVLIGYTARVTESLAGVCAVQHAPWDVSDGGGRVDSAGRGLPRQLAHHPRGRRPVQRGRDSLQLRAARHDATNGTRCANVYLKQLMNITHRLIRTKARVGPP